MDLSAPLEDARYNRVSIWFHWSIAALIVVNLLLGFFREDIGDLTGRSVIYGHKATGFAILGLSVGRLLWRVGHRPPPFDAVMSRWEALLARATHWLIYVLMIALPLSGWVLVSNSNRATDFFGLFTIPPLPVSRSKPLHETLEDVHEWLGFAMIGLIALHVAGALKHHLQGHRHLIGRMGPWLYRGR